MKQFKAGLALCVVAALIVMLGVWMAPQSKAATANPSPASVGYEILPFYIPGPITATTTPIKFRSPWPFRVVGVSAYARAATGGTYTVDVQQGTTSLLASPISIASAATVYEATLATTPNISDEATVSVILTLGGSNPIASDVTVLMMQKRQ